MLGGEALLSTVCLRETRGDRAARGGEHHAECCLPLAACPCTLGTSRGQCSRAEQPQKGRVWDQVTGTGGRRGAPCLAPAHGGDC